MYRENYVLKALKYAQKICANSNKKERIFSTKIHFTFISSTLCAKKVED